ncbi:MAG: hypothetical protein AUJ72_00750 [Candidatus Omnitrophica bacterium CG1_02_46_14]|nr:MAG: hypothetical protein AUJ72_00750 [Candidatus Omnitrophica bacterium CG1_02_46_14]
MKIVFINRYFYPDISATSQILGDLAFYLSEQKKDVWVITSRQRYDDPCIKLPKYEIVHGVRVHRICTTSFGRYRFYGRVWDYLTFYWSAGIFLACRLKKGDTVISMTDPPLFSVIAAVLSRFCNARVIHWIQDLFPETAELLKVGTVNPAISQWIRKLRNWSLRASVFNVVICEAMAARLAGEGVERDKIRVIENWADGAHIKPLSKEKNPLIQEWKLKGKFIIEYSGNMGRAHEFMTIIEAAELLKDEKNIIFLFIGDGSEKPRIEAEFRRRRLENYLFKPYQSYEKLSESLGVADAHLISLKRELEGCVFPSKIYGILAAGRPVLWVGDPDGDIGSLMAQEDYGYAVETGNFKALAERIKTLMRDPLLLESIGKRSRTVFDDLYAKNFRLKEWQKILK